MIIADANNLYGHAMSHPLPTGNFQFPNLKEIGEFDMSKRAANDDIGFILDVDLKYPVNIHESHNDYPFSAENVKITQDMLSPYSRSLIKKYSSTEEKLAPSLNDKIKYVLHFENLRLNLELGMELVKIHRILQYRSYVIILAKFVQTFRKQRVWQNMECLRNRINLKQVTNPIRAKKLIARPTFQRFDIINKDLTSITMMKDKVLINRPMYHGFSILDLSKITMYRFHYQQIIARYGNKAK